MKKIDKPLLQINDLSFRYPGMKQKKDHLEKLNLNIFSGTWVTILGPNGAGKSTLAKLIVKINRFHNGEILLNNKNIKNIKGKEFAKNIAYIPQQIDVPHGTKVYDFIAFGRNPYLGLTGILGSEDKKQIQKAIKATRVEHLTEKMMDELSGGERQKVLFAMILAQDAEIILLDEPTTYLDIRNQYELLEMLKAQNLKKRTIITILHDINQAVQYSDYIYLLKKGKVVAEGEANKVINTEILEKVYGIKAELHQINERKYLTNVALLN